MKGSLDPQRGHNSKVENHWFRGTNQISSFYHRFCEPKALLLGPVILALSNHPADSDTHCSLKTSGPNCNDAPQTELSEGLICVAWHSISNKLSDGVDSAGSQITSHATFPVIDLAQMTPVISRDLLLPLPYPSPSAYQLAFQCCWCSGEVPENKWNLPLN